MLIAGTGRRSVHNRTLGSPRIRLTRLLRLDGNTVANYQPGNYTGTLNASAWLNSIGTAPSLVQATGVNQPVIQADGSPQLLFTGASTMLSTFTLNLPETIYAVLNPITWTTHGILGGAVGEAGIYQWNGGGSVSPVLALRNGGASYVAADLTHGTLNKYHILLPIFDGASSSFKIDNNSANTGDPGSSNPGGLALGYTVSDATPSNFQVKEIIVRSATDSAAMQAQIVSLLNAIHGVY